MSCYCDEGKSPGASLRRQVKAGGAVCFVLQCCGCGCRIGQEVSRRALIAKGEDPDALPAFDQALAERVVAARMEKFQAHRTQVALEDEARRADFNRRRREHMQSAKWAELRDKVLKRDRQVCQGCMTGFATEVHHLTYSHLGDELAYQLISLCQECHQKTHHIEAAAT